MSKSTKIGIVQMCASADVRTNMKNTLALSSEAVDDGAEVVFLPEAFSYIGSERQRQMILESCNEGGPILDACKGFARDNAVHLIAGGFPEAADDGRAYNACLHIDTEGTIRTNYRKIHLFDVDLPDGTRILESRGTCPGNTAAVAKLPFGTLGLTVCYDVRFPLLYQQLVDMGAIAITVPAAFTKTTGRDHWHVLLRARAIECQSYIIAPAQYGDHEHRNRRSFGHAMVIDPWGTVIAECDADQDDFRVVEIDPAEVERVRTQLPSLKNRRQWT